MTGLHLRFHLPREKCDQCFRHLLNTNPHLRAGEYLLDLRLDDDGEKDFTMDKSWITTTKTLPESPRHSTCSCASRCPHSLSTRT